MATTKRMIGRATVAASTSIRADSARFSTVSATTVCHESGPKQCGSSAMDADPDESHGAPRFPSVDGLRGGKRPPYDEAPELADGGGGGCLSAYRTSCRL